MARRGLRALALACGLGALVPATASAREDTFAYPYGSVWETAVRMLRVDFASPITEKDRDDGYFLFDYEHDGKHHPGSVEVVRTREGGRELVRVVIQVPAMPSYVEQMMLDRLERKLGTEHGAPLTAAPAPPQKPAPTTPEPDKTPKAKRPN